MKNLYFLFFLCCSTSTFSQEWTQKNDFPLDDININLPSFTVNEENYIIHSILAKLCKYDADTDTWSITTIDWMVDVGYQHGFALTIGDKVYVAAGLPGIPGDNQQIFYEFDPSTEIWTQLTDIPNLLFHSSIPISTFTYEGKGYLLFHHKMISYDPATDTWTDNISSYPDSPYIFNTTHFFINGKFYAGAGNNSSLESSPNFFEYDPETNSWTQIADYPHSTTPLAMMSFAIDGKGYTGLGQGSIYDSQFYSYNPSTDSWSMVLDCGYVAKAAFTFTSNGKGYIGGGWRTSPIEFYDDLWEYDPTILSAENYSSTSISIFPNPAHNVLNIDSQSPLETVKIYTISGGLIKEASNSSIDVFELPSGLYFARISIDGETFTKKFVKY